MAPSEYDELIALVRNQYPPEKAARIAAALTKHKQQALHPLAFAPTTGGWLVGRDAHFVPNPCPPLRGLFPAWEAISRGEAHVGSHATEEEADASGSLRRSIHRQCAAWARLVAGRDFEAVFLAIKVEKERIVYPAHSPRLECLL